ncbi:MAG: tetratricopeptide repeat protein [Pirellulaceae bacterium]
MPFWPFKSKLKESVPLSPTELRDQLIQTAATGSAKSLRTLCKQRKSEVAEHVDLLCKIPDGIPTDDGSVDRHFQSLVAIAQCLANECDAPQLWQKLCGNDGDNPLMQFDHWYGELTERMQNLEHEVLIDEANAFIEKVKTLRGTAARLHETYLYGRLGEVLFHSGRAAEAIEAHQTALGICVDSGDVEGQVVYWNNLSETHLYLDDGQAVECAEHALALLQENAMPSDEVERRLGQLRAGVPLCRVVCVSVAGELELDDLTPMKEGRLQFLFRRNRMSMQKATTLTANGNKLAEAGQYAEAMEKYHEASDVDPHDPDPVYQSGMCLMELGAYAKAREAFEEVERLAPGWFRCRSDRWLADGMDQGLISVDQFQLLRILDDGGLNQPKAKEIAERAVAEFPDFAPFFWLLGNACRESKQAIEAYRKGLEVVEEPDLESRLLCSLAGQLPADSPERSELVDRALTLKGSLVSLATAKLIG